MFVINFDKCPNFKIHLNESSKSTNWMNGVETRTPTVRHRRFKYMHIFATRQLFYVFKQHSQSELLFDGMLHQQPLKQLLITILLFSSFFHNARPYSPSVCLFLPSIVVSCAFISFVQLKSRHLFTASDWHILLQ